MYVVVVVVVIVVVAVVIIIMQLLKEFEHQSVIFSVLLVYASPFPARKDLRIPILFAIFTMLVNR